MFTGQELGHLDSRYLLLEQLGSEGQSGVVFEAWDTQDAIKVAIKKFNGCSLKQIKAMKNEAIAYKKVSHQNVIECLSFGVGTFNWFDYSMTTEKAPYIVLELCQNATLFEFVEGENAFSEGLACHVLKQVLNGLDAIHKSGQSHRDIKCENILFTQKFEVKIGDFGLVGELEDLNTIVGTRSWTAPEIENLKDCEVYDGAPADVFSLGVLLFCMLFKRMPFHDAKSDDRHYRYIELGQSHNFWKLHKIQGIDIDSVPENCRNLISQMLTRKPYERPSISEILNSEWMASNTSADPAAIT